MDITAIAIVFIVIGLPIILVVQLAVARMQSRQRQVEALLKERELLIEKGATDLPGLELPLQSAKRDRLGSLRSAIVLLFLSAALLFSYMVLPITGVVLSALMLQTTILLGAIGLAMLLIHFVSLAYEAREAQTVA